MGKKRGQHYVWKHYLTAWIKEGNFYCLQDNNIFPTNPKNIGQSRDFYRLKDLSPLDIKFITEVLIERSQVPAEIKKINKNWITQFTRIFDIKRSLEKRGLTTEDINSEIDILINNLEEDHHCRLEAMALPYLNLLREGNIDFYKTVQGNIDFNLFLCTQYFRTNKIKIAVINSVKKSLQIFSPQIDVENIWNVSSHIFATNMSHQLFIDMNNYSCLILKNNTSIPFITGDQPVINTCADYSTNEVTEDLELYYPITPSISFLISRSSDMPKSSPIQLDEHEVTKYNNLIFKASEKQVFASEMSILQRYIK